MPSNGEVTAFCDFTKPTIFSRDYLPAPGQQVNEDWARGTDFNDIIQPSSGGRSFIEGRGGDDIIIGDADETGGRDHISGGS